MKRFRFISVFTVAILALVLTVQIGFGDSGWTPVIAGVDWRLFQLPGPNRAFVTRMDRSNPSLTLESGLPRGTLSGERQTVSEMAMHYDETLSAWDGSWGERNHVVAAINGSYFDLGTGEPNNGMVVGGWYAKMYSDLGGWSGFAWQRDRDAFVGACVDHPPGAQTITNLIRGYQVPIHGINTESEQDQLVVYTPQYDTFSPGQKNGAEILVGLYQPLGLRESSESTIGTVLNIHRGQGPVPIPFDTVVLSANGSSAEDLLRAVQTGDVLSFSLQLRHYEANCRNGSPFSWAGTYASLGGTLPFLREGEVIPFQDEGASQKHPRTAICFNDDWLFFVVVDGRKSGYSVGMTIPELAEFCRDQLGATWGVNQDGGGSSTLWLDGEVINRPSGGEQRRVANSIMIVSLEPMRRSSTLATNATVLTRYATNLHLGPGTNYPAITSVAEGAQGTVQPHLAGLNGVFAKGAYWWKVRFEGVEGWVDEAALELISNPPLSFSTIAGKASFWSLP